jgi:hypothetical protein
MIFILKDCKNCFLNQGFLSTSIDFYLHFASTLNPIGGVSLVNYRSQLDVGSWTGRLCFHVHG